MLKSCSKYGEAYEKPRKSPSAEKEKKAGGEEASNEADSDDDPQSLLNLMGSASLAPDAKKNPKAFEKRFGRIYG